MQAIRQIRFSGPQVRKKRPECPETLARKGYAAFRREKSAAVFIKRSFFPTVMRSCHNAPRRNRQTLDFAEQTGFQRGKIPQKRYALMS